MDEDAILRIANVINGQGELIIKLQDRVADLETAVSVLEMATYPGAA